LNFELLITQKEFDLLEGLNIGDRVRDMVLYAPWAVTKVDGKVVHKSELQDGDHKGCFMLGTKSLELIANGKISKRYISAVRRIPLEQKEITSLERLEGWVYPFSGGISQWKVRTSIFYTLSYILCFMGSPTVLNSLSTNKVCMGFLNRVYRRQKACPCIFSFSGDWVRKQF
jgi:sulfur carrier protein ThiS